ncbi:hypothetical protein GCM10020000_71580 [Streptomyces olivoverticillatus]
MAVEASGIRAATTAVLATSSSGAVRKAGPVPTGGDGFLAHQLAQVAPRLGDARPGPAFQAGPYLPHQPGQQRGARNDRRDLGGHRGGPDGPGGVHAPTARARRRATRPKNP